MDSVTIDRRQRQRIVAMLLCEIEALGMPLQLVRVCDLSDRGLRIASPERLGTRRAVRVRLPGTQNWVKARVAWSEDGVTGLSFPHPIELPAMPVQRLAPR